MYFFAGMAVGAGSIIMLSAAVIVAVDWALDNIIGVIR